MLGKLLHVMLPLGRVAFYFDQAWQAIDHFSSRGYRIITGCDVPLIRNGAASFVPQASVIGWERSVGDEYPLGRGCRQIILIQYSPNPSRRFRFETNGCRIVLVLEEFEPQWVATTTNEKEASRFCSHLSTADPGIN